MVIARSNTGGTSASSGPGTGATIASGASVDTEMRAIFGASATRLERTSREPPKLRLPPQIEEEIEEAPPRSGRWLFLGLLATAALAGGFIVIEQRFEAAPDAGRTPTVTVPLADAGSTTGCADGGSHGCIPSAPAPVVAARQPMSIAPPKVALPAPAAAPLPAAPAATPSAEQVAAGEPAVVKTDPRCVGTGYEHASTCPPRAVLAADRDLSAAYAAAIHANVDPSHLATFSQRWEQLRQDAAAHPGDAVSAYRDMTEELDGLSGRGEARDGDGSAPAH